MLTAVDLFAGLGGFTEGAEQAGIKVLHAANHWPEAVRQHRINHPKTYHACQDLRQADFTEWPDHDILMASPCCQGHSKARGKDKPHHDAARATAYAVFECACAKLPPYIVVENVPEFLKWGTKQKPGIFYTRWMLNFEDLGYTIKVNHLDSSTFGLAQTRNRIYITMVHNSVADEPIVVNNGGKKPAPVKDILDWNGKHKWSLVAKPGRCQRTLKRISNARIFLGKKFIIEYYGSAPDGRSLNQPLGAITTRDRYALIDGPWMRMLTPREYLRAQGFPEGYVIPKKKSLAVHMIGNAVSVPVAKVVLTTVQQFATVGCAA